MRAVGIWDFGGPEVLQPLDLPEPEVGPGQVKVAVTFAGVNPTDTLRREGIKAVDASPDEMVRAQPRPLVPGMEVAGVVEEIGPDTETALAVGDHVIGFLFPNGAHGGYSEKLVLPADSVALAPSNVDDAAAATIALNGMTARLALDELGLTAGQTLAVTGAAGAVGAFVVQLAAVDGIRVVADAAPADEEYLRQVGAEWVVARGDDVVDRFREAVPGGTDALVDAAILNEKVVGAVKPGGILVTLRHYSTDPIDGVSFVPVRVRTYVHEQAKLDALARLVEAGKLTLRPTDVYAATDAPAAHARLAQGGNRRRIVLAFGDSDVAQSE